MTKNLLWLTCAFGALWSVGLRQPGRDGRRGGHRHQPVGATNVTEIVVTAGKSASGACVEGAGRRVRVHRPPARRNRHQHLVADADQLRPGLTYDRGNVHAYIRGVGRQSPVNVTDDQRVANYEDEFYVYSPYGPRQVVALPVAASRSSAVRRSVGGRNAAAGLIDMISVRPTDEPYAGGPGFTVGNFGALGRRRRPVSGQVAAGLDHAHRRLR